LWIAAGGRDELIVSSQGKVYAYDPQTGEQLWTVRGNTFEVIPDAGRRHGLVFLLVGARRPTLAIRPAGGAMSRTLTSRGARRAVAVRAVGNRARRLALHDQRHAKHSHRGRRAHRRAVYQERLGEAIREGFSSSPVAVGDKIFLTNDLGQTFVVQAGTDVQADPRQRAARAGARVAGPRRWHVVLADGPLAARNRQPDEVIASERQGPGAD
jgi:hypothetical protein